MLTATPMPYHYRDFTGLLSFLQSPWDGAVARDRIRGAGKHYDMANEGVLQNPYERNSANKALRPKDVRYCYTAAAFEKFVVQPGLDPETAGPLLATVFEKFMIRRDYSSSCIVDHEGTKHTIGQSMRAVKRYNLRLENDSWWQWLHNGLISEWTGQVVCDSNTEAVYQNAAASRIMGLGAVSPLLLLARDIHQAKVPIEGDSVMRPINSKIRSHRGLDPVSSDGEEEDEEHDDDILDLEDMDINDFGRGVRTSQGTPGRNESKEKKQEKMESPHLAKYRELFQKGDYHGWMSKLMQNIHDEALKLKGTTGEVYEFLFAHKKPLAQWTSKQKVKLLMQSSSRLRAMFACISDQVDNLNEKAIIFALNPWEQQLYTVILNLMDYKASAYLATMKSDVKAKIISDFQAPLARWVEPAFNGLRPTDMEVLVLSYHMNSGLNLHPSCHNIHAPSPPPSYSIWVQTVGRVARFGQAYDCVVISYIMPKTFNISQYSSMTKNALYTISALTCTVRPEGDGFAEIPGVSYQALKHYHGFHDTLVDDRLEGFDKFEATGNVDYTLEPNEKFLRILNCTLGKTRTVAPDEAETYVVEEAPVIFASYLPMLSASKSKKTRTAAMLDPPSSPSPSQRKTKADKGKGKSKAETSTLSEVMVVDEPDLMSDEDMPIVGKQTDFFQKRCSEQQKALAEDKFTKNEGKKRKNREEKKEQAQGGGPAKKTKTGVKSTSSIASTSPPPSSPRTYSTMGSEVEMIAPSESSSKKSTSSRKPTTRSRTRKNQEAKDGKE
ncbi:hypothetical protein ACN47E_002046 [Coniothyrium glycines]